jgi:hypothetical protein
LDVNFISIHVAQLVRQHLEKLHELIDKWRDGSDFTRQKLLQFDERAGA